MKGAKAVGARKKQNVSDFSELVEKSPVVGIVDVENLPARQLRNMREQLRGEVTLRMTKKSLMRIALKNCEEKKKGVSGLSSHLRGMPAMVFANINPFALYKKLNANKSSAPAKPGQTATKDIIVPAGQTPFSPGPIIGELGALKIKTSIENGKVAVKEAAVVCRRNQVIDAKVAQILARLGIEPMEIGLNITAVYENGQVYTGDVLAVDEKEYMGRISGAARESFALAVSCAYMSEETAGCLLTKALQEAVALSLECGFATKDTTPLIVARAESHARALASMFTVKED